MSKWARRARTLAGSCAWCLVQINSATASAPPTATIEAVSVATACGYSRPLRPVDLQTAIAQSLHMQPQLRIARANVLESKSRLTAARGSLLPQIQLSAVNELYAPSNGSTSFVVVNNTVLGGTQAISAYASIGLDWTLWSSGRNWAAYHAATAGIRAAELGVVSQTQNTLSGVLHAYEDLYDAEVAARNDAMAASALEAIRARAQRRYEHGYGTAVALGRARVRALNAQNTLNDACRTVEEKSQALEQVAGLDLLPLRPLSATEPLPLPQTGILGGTGEDVRSGDDATVTAFGDKSEQVRIGVDARRHVAIDREEIAARKRKGIHRAGLQAT